MRYLTILLAALALTTACGEDGGTGSDCGFDGNAYLPYAVGYTWTYQVTDLGDGSRTQKSQTITSMMTDATFGDVLVQETTKATGRTINLTKVESETVTRYRQEDYDETGAFERATEYDPKKLRLDMTAANTTVGAKWDETYTAIEKDMSGAETGRVSRVDNWEVMGVDVDCTSPFGSFKCLHIRRVRTMGGVADKEFYFAKGIGKVREVGGQLEELTGCSAQ